MEIPISNKIPLHVLVKESGRFFLVFLFGTLLITSLNDLRVSSFVQKALSLSTLLVLIFIANSLLLYHFEQKRRSASERIWKKAFLYGYIFSLIIFFIHHSTLQWLITNGYVDKVFQNPELNGLRLYIFLLYATLVIYCIIFLIQITVLQQYEKNRIQMELLQLKVSNSEAINQLLRQQIQPHFLFNALTILKSLIRREPKRAESYLLHLSDFLRISISKNTSGVASIAEELKTCHNYMEMQSIRFGDALQYQVDIKETDPILKQKLPFFSLQPLLENAIKHNELTNNNPLYITIKQDGNYILVSNNLQTKQILEESTGKGLGMLNERYKILNYELPEIKTDHQTFTVRLRILDYEHSTH